MKNFLRNKKGMTYVELLVAMTLLVLIIMAFSPMMLKAYNEVYGAGEETVKTYTAKTNIEKRLSIREDDPVFENMKISYKQFESKLYYNMRQIADSLSEIETLYATSSARIDIVTSPDVSDNQDYEVFAVKLVNINATAANLTTGSDHENGKVVVNLTVPATIADPSKNMSIGNGGKSTATYNIDATTIATKGYFILKVYDVDITYSPLKMTVYYFDDNNKKCKAETYLYISAPDIMLVGKSKGSDAQFITSAGFNEGKLLLAGRVMKEAPISNGQVINKVRYIANGDDPLLTGGTYVMVGNNSFVRRLWDLSDTTYTLVPNKAANFFVVDNRVSMSGEYLYKKYWAEDYLTADRNGTSWNGSKSSDRKNSNFDQTANSAKSYGKAYAVTYDSRYKTTGAHVIQISWVPGVNAAQTADGFSFSTGSTQRKLFLTHGSYDIENKNYDKDPKYSNRAILLQCNWQAGDGVAFGQFGDYAYHFWNEDILQLKTGTWANCVRYEDVASSLNNHNYMLRSNLTLTDSLGQTHSGYAWSSDGVSYYGYVPLVFFSYDNTIEHIDRVYLCKDNNWGSGLGDVVYDAYGFNYFIVATSVNKGKRKTTKQLSWLYTTDNGQVSPTGCPPRENQSDDTAVSHSLNHEALFNFHSDNKTNSALAWYNLPGWNQDWGSNYNHSCYICDKAANFCTPIIGYEFQKYDDASFSTTDRNISNQKISSSADQQRFNENQQTVYKFILDYFANERETIPGTATSFIGYRDDPGSNDYTLNYDDVDTKIASIFMKAYSNAYMRFADYSLNDSALQKAYGELFKKAENYDIINNNSASTQVDLTDIGCITTDTGSQMVYLGVSPAAALVYSPYINSVSHSNKVDSDGYNVYIIQSNGKDGFSIRFDERVADHYGGHSFGDLSGTLAADSYTKYTSASFTLGYSSARKLIYSPYSNTEICEAGYTDNHVVGMTTSKGTYCDDKLHMPDDFYNITTYETVSQITFGIGYKVTGKVSTAVATHDNCTDASHPGITENYAVFPQKPEDLFNSSNFKVIKGGAKDENAMASLAVNRWWWEKNGANVSSAQPLSLTTLRNGPGTQLNTASSNAATVRGFYYNLKITAADESNYHFIGDYPKCTTSYAVLQTSDSGTTNAITNEGLLQYQVAGSSKFTQIACTFNGTAPQNYKFTSISILDMSTNTAMKYRLFIGASNGCLYYGDVTFVSDGDTVRIANPAVVLTAVSGLNLSDAHAVCAENFGDGKSIVAVSGKQANNGTYIAYSTDNGATWNGTKIKASDTKYNIYDIKVAGDYLYAAGADEATDTGVVIYTKILDTNGNLVTPSWSAQTKYSTKFSHTPEAVVIGTDSLALPPIYSMDSKI